MPAAHGGYERGGLVATVRMDDLACAPSQSEHPTTQTCKAAVEMQPSARARASDAARSIAATVGLGVDDAIVLQDSNRLTVRLMPCDVVARVAPVASQESAEFEVALARCLMTVGSSAAALD